MALTDTPLPPGSLATCLSCDWAAEGSQSHIEAKAHSELNMHITQVVEHP
jgi:hypothetical protein